MINYNNLDHIGIAVSNLDAAIAEYQTKFGFELDTRETIESQGVEVAFLKLNNTLLEFIAPNSEKSALNKFLEKRGPGLHHLCYRVDDINAALEDLKQKGIRIIDETPRPGAHNTLIAFLHPKDTGGVLTELCQHQG